jgi:DNA-binding response OmpR family regulator
VDLDLAPYVVLRELMRRPGAVVSQAQLIEASWPDPDLEPARPEDAIRVRICRAREALEQVGAPREQLALRFPRGYSIEGERRVVRSFTPAQAAIVDRLLATHPDRAAVQALAA